MRARPDFDGRRLAEAVRFLERDGATPLAAPAVEAEADAVEAAIVARARGTAVAEDLAAAIGQVDHALRWVVAGLLAAALVAGGATAAAAMGGPPDESGVRTLNLIETLVAVLGLQTLLLLAWLVLSVARPRLRATSPLLWLPGAVLRRLARLGDRRPEALGGRSRLAAAARATAEPLTSPGLARATASSLAHGTWTSFTLGALAVMVVLLVGREYRFTWETTLLSDAAGERVVRTLLAGPDAVGVSGPGEEAIVLARPGTAGALSDADRQAWARATLAMVALYGLAPRAVLLALAAALRSRRRRRWRLDLERPGHARLVAALRPASHPRPSENGHGRLPERPAPPAEAPAIADEAAGGPVIVRLETDLPGGAWPPPVPGADWRDLGMVDGRRDEHRVADALRDLDPPPSRVVAAIDLAITPDRGHERFLATLRDEGRRRLRLVLTGGQTLRDRRGAEAVRARVDAWRRAGGRIGLDPAQVLELDLDHATSASLDRLAAMLALAPATDASGAPGDAGGGAGGSPPESHLDSAFELVAEAVGRWRTAPDVAEQAELHRAIQRRYRVDGGRLARLLGIADAGGDAGPAGAAGAPDGEAAARAGAGAGAAASAAGRARAGLRSLSDASPETLAATMRSAAGHVRDRLPPGLRASPRWAVAGAMAGACGCLAAAATLTPLAVTALPAWAGGGAVLAAVARSLRSEAARAAGADGGEDAGAADPAGAAARTAHETGAAVDAAVLQVLVLELQGRDEAVISRVLERTLGGGRTAAATAPLVPGDVAAVRRRLDDVRERFDGAMAAEVGR